MKTMHFKSKENQSITVRHAASDDADNLFAGFNSVVSEGLWLPTFRPNAHVADWLHWIQKTRHTRESLLVAEIEGTYAGHLTLQPEDWIASKHVAKLGVIVLEHYRGKGIGRALMLAAEEVAVEDGYEKITLSTFEDNLIALNLYESLNYRTVGIRRNHFKMPRYIDEVLMEKELLVTKK